MHCMYHASCIAYIMHLFHHASNKSCIACIMHGMHQASHASWIACIKHRMIMHHTLHTKYRLHTVCIYLFIYSWNSLRSNRPTDIATYRTAILAKNWLSIFCLHPNIICIFCNICIKHHHTQAFSVGILVLKLVADQQLLELVAVKPKFLVADKLYTTYNINFNHL